jgi:hypothetical protein
MQITAGWLLDTPSTGEIDGAQHVRLWSRQLIQIRQLE